MEDVGAKMRLPPSWLGASMFPEPLGSWHGIDAQRGGARKTPSPTQIHSYSQDRSPSPSVSQRHLREGQRSPSFPHASRKFKCWFPMELAPKLSTPTTLFS